MNFLVENWGALLGILAALIVVAKMVVKLTPTKTDDDIVDRIDSLEKTLEGVFKTAPHLAPTEVITKAP